MDGACYQEVGSQSMSLSGGSDSNSWCALSGDRLRLSLLGGSSPGLWSENDATRGSKMVSNSCHGLLFKVNIHGAESGNHDDIVQN